MTEAAAAAAPGPPMAFIGVRSCELRAIAVQDRVFLGGQHPDPVYAGNRDDAFLVAVTCGQAGGTCFCVSMDSGPRAESGFDLALTEFHQFGTSGCVGCGRCVTWCPVGIDITEEAAAIRSTDVREAGHGDH